MSDDALPTIVIDGQNLDKINLGISGVDTTDEGHSVRPMSNSSSDGSLLDSCLGASSTTPIKALAMTL